MSGRVWLFLIAAVAVSGVVAYAIAPTSNAGFTEGASALAFVTLVAVAIERLLEMWWAIVGGSGQLGGWWPLNQVTTAMADAEKEANKLLTPIVADIQSALTAQRAALAAAGESTEEIDLKLKLLDEERGKLKAQLATAKKLAPGSARMALVTKVVADGSKVADDVVAVAGKATTELQKAIAAAKQGTDLATTIVGAFSDNPARRMMSILLGASLGLLVAGFLGLNLFAPILEGESSIVSGVVGILLTGIVMGLGSSPTHEVIKAIQQYKESRKPAEMAAGGEDAHSARAAMAPEGFVRATNAEGIPLRSTQ